jgi:hypothetical protein
LREQSNKPGLWKRSSSLSRLAALLPDSSAPFVMPPTPQLTSQLSAPSSRASEPISAGSHKGPGSSPSYGPMSSSTSVPSGLLNTTPSTLRHVHSAHKLSSFTLDGPLSSSSSSSSSSTHFPATSPSTTLDSGNTSTGMRLRSASNASLILAQRRDIEADAKSEDVEMDTDPAPPLFSMLPRSISHHQQLGVRVLSISNSTSNNNINNLSSSSSSTTTTTATAGGGPSPSPTVLSTVSSGNSPNGSPASSSTSPTTA